MRGKPKDTHDTGTLAARQCAPKNRARQREPAKGVAETS